MNSVPTHKRPAGAGFLTPPSAMRDFYNRQRNLLDTQVAFAVSEDMSEIEHALALSYLLSHLDLDQFLKNQLSENLYRVVCQEALTLDHVGIEVFSPVRELTPLIRQYIVQGEIKTHIFKSVQVLEMLQTYDTDLKQVDIMMLENSEGYKDRVV